MSPMPSSEHSQGKTGTPRPLRATEGWARAVIMLGMMGVVLLAAIPNLIAHPPSRAETEPGLLPLLAYVRGI